jgi:hypothetical protein
MRNLKGGKSHEYAWIYCRGVCLYEKRILPGADFWSYVGNTCRRNFALYDSTSRNAPYWSWYKLSSTWWGMSDLRLYVLPVSLLVNN